MAGPNREIPSRYVLRVDGHLDARWSAWFDDLELQQHDDGTSTLTGIVQDQAQLHGLLAKVRDLGVRLIELHVTDGP
jgi:hypothetical protein